MAIYDISGNSLGAVYDIDGTSLGQAYDIDENPLLPGENLLTVMSYNVQWFTGINSQETMQNLIIQNNDADIIGFQEFSRNTSVPTVGANILSDYSTIRLGNHINYSAIASKIALSDITIADYATQDTHDVQVWHETRYYMKSYFTQNGRRICWFNTHLCVQNTEPKYAQMLELFNMAEQEEYCIITADFNSFAHSVEDDDYINMFKQFVDAGYNLANCSSESGFTNTYSGSTTAASTSDLTTAPDSIITTGNIDIVSVLFDITKFQYLNGNAIDHIPVVAHLRIN